MQWKHKKTRTHLRSRCGPRWKHPQRQGQRWWTSKAWTGCSNSSDLFPSSWQPLKPATWQLPSAASCLQDRRSWQYDWRCPEVGSEHRTTASVFCPRWTVVSCYDVIALHSELLTNRDQPQSHSHPCCGPSCLVAHAANTDRLNIHFQHHWLGTCRKIYQRKRIGILRISGLSPMIIKPTWNGRWPMASDARQSIKPGFSKWPK